MNEILKIGIVFCICSIITFRLVSNPQNVEIIILIGIILTSVGFVINEYQAYKQEKTF